MSKRPKRKSSEDSAREAGIRGLRLEEIFREELNSILSNEIGDGSLEGARVTMVELSPDGARARIWVAAPSTSPDRQARDLESAFARAGGFLRARLCEALPLKRMPELRFRYDPAAVLEASSADDQEKSLPRSRDD